jgi:CRP-like cAMP-binding protein
VVRDELAHEDYGLENLLIRKLEQFARLSSDDKRALDDIARLQIRRLGPREDIIREGDRPEHLDLILSGWACRYKTLEDGRRQIMAFFVPGDVYDLNLFVLREMDHSIAALTQVTVSEISRDAITTLTLNHPRIAQALWWDTLVAAAMQREWTVNLGQRTAFERVGHLLCELFLRLQAVGLADKTSCVLPVTQVELADATGLSAVHVNRTLQEMRAADLIHLRGKTLEIPDLDALKAAALFNPNYLHLDREGRHLDAPE